MKNSDENANQLLNDDFNRFVMFPIVERNNQTNKQINSCVRMYVIICIIYLPTIYMVNLFAQIECSCFQNTNKR